MNETQLKRKNLIVSRACYDLDIANPVIVVITAGGQTLSTRLTLNQESEYQRPHAGSTGSHDVPVGTSSLTVLGYSDVR
jgi:hypothetical protein